MKVISAASNILIIIGVLLSLIGLVDKLGFVDSIFYRYCFSIGIIMFGIGILFSGFVKKTKKEP